MSAAALALNDDDFNARYKVKALTKAADYFGDHAKRRMPVRPDEWAAEMLASVLGSLIGNPEPEPLPDLPHIGDMQKSSSGPGGAIAMLPEAKALLRAKGYARVVDSVAHVYSAFLQFPETEWTAREMLPRLPKKFGSTGNVSSCFYSLLQRGCIVDCGRGHYKLAPGL